MTKTRTTPIANPATPIANPATATPMRIDTALAELDREYHMLSGTIAGAVDFLHTIDDQRARHIGRGGRKVWPKGDGDTVTSVRTKVKDGVVSPIYRERAVSHLAELDAATTRAQDNRMEFARLDDEYLRRPWNRYIVVAGGHIHHGTQCAGGTIRPSTQLGWRPELSGKSVADAVAELGPLLCTHCFPDAPVEWKAGEIKPEHCAGCGFNAPSQLGYASGMTMLAVPRD